MVVEETVETASLDCMLPPLILQPLIENAIKHGVATMDEAARVALNASVEGGALLVKVTNQYDADANVKRGAGLGLNNIRERLDVSYGDAARLSSGGSDGTWCVELRLPAEQGIGT
jgi:LytS/YehU family sensor histidine kinase